MTEVNVDKLVHENKMRDTIESFKEKREENSIKNSILDKKRKFYIKAKFNRAPLPKISNPVLNEEVLANLRKTSEENKEISNIVKDFTFKATAYTIKKEKREIFESHLKESTILNNYVDENIGDYFHLFNSHIKATLEYSRLYIKSLNS
jgi:hypothetical protein